jgi:hypothetical protein
MRETITFEHHAQHAWLHFTIRLLIVLLVLFLLLVLTENSFGQRVKQEMSQAAVWEAERPLCRLVYWTGPIDGVFDNG